MRTASELMVVTPSGAMYQNSARSRTNHAITLGDALCRNNVPRRPTFINCCGARDRTGRYVLACWRIQAHATPPDGDGATVRVKVFETGDLTKANGARRPAGHERLAQVAAIAAGAPAVVLLGYDPAGGRKPTKTWRITEADAEQPWRVVGITPPDGDGVTWARLARF